MNIKCQPEIAEAYTNVSSCFTNGTFAPAEEGKQLLSFILRSDWDEIPDAAKAAVGGKLQEMIEKNKKPEMVFRDLYLWVFPTR